MQTVVCKRFVGEPMRSFPVLEGFFVFSYFNFTSKIYMNYLVSLLKLRCPKCRKGKMFRFSSYSFKGISPMNKSCPNCKISYQLEPSFFYGSMYVSYALGVAMAVATYLLLLLLGFGKNMVLSIMVIAITIILFAPYNYQLSKVIWASFFINYDPKKS